MNLAAPASARASGMALIAAQTPRSARPCTYIITAISVEGNNRTRRWSVRVISKDHGYIVASK